MMQCFYLFLVGMCRNIWCKYQIPAIGWIFKNIVSVLFLSCSAPCCPALFLPRGDAFDLDQSCLSTSAGHKGPRGKLFILTSFRENKPYSLGAPVPPEESEKRNPRGCPGGRQLSLCRHDLRPGSGYWHGRAGASQPPRSSAVRNIRTPCSNTREHKNNPTQWRLFVPHLITVAKRHMKECWL